MKKLFRFLLLASIAIAACPTAHSATTFTLQPLNGYGNHGDGSIRPGDSIGSSPFTGNDVQISAPGIGIQPNDPSFATNGNSMRGLAYDPVTTHLVFLDTHNSANASGGGGTNAPNGGIYILDGDSGQIIGQLSTNGIVGGTIGTYISTGVADDGVVYAANQINFGAGPFKIYRWPTADPSASNFTNAPTVAFSNSAPTAVERMATTIAVRGAGTNTVILACPVTVKAGVGGASQGTNIFLFTTADGTNFVHHQLYVPNLPRAPGSPANGGFQDGVAFGPTNTFFAKEVGQALYYIAYPSGINPAVASTNACTLISYHIASGPNDPLLNIAAIAYDNVNHLLGGLEEIGGTAQAGNGKVWIHDFSDPTNRPPAILASRVYPVNFAKALTTMGFLAFGNGRLYATAVNNGFLVNTVQSTTLSPPSYSWTDYNTEGATFTRNSDLPATTRALVNTTAHFEVLAVPDVTNYQWYSNNVPVANNPGYYLDVPNVQAANSNDVFYVVAFNAAGSATSATSTLQVVSPSQFFHPFALWSYAPGATNWMTTGVNERSIAYNALSNQLLVARGPAFATVRIWVVDAQTGAFLYTLKTNGMVTSAQLPLCSVGVADDGAVYASSVNTTTVGDQSFKVYRWADSGSNTLPVCIYGTNSSAASGNPAEGWTGSQTYRFGDNLAVHGSGNNTEIIVDSQNSTKFAGILRPVPDGYMTNWTATAYLLQNIPGSYGSQGYGTTIGRSLQFGPVMSGPLGDLPTFWQKRYNGAAGAPLAGMGYQSSGPALAPLDVANNSSPLFTNGPVGINFTLKVAASIAFPSAIGNAGTTPDTLNYYDLSDPSQAILLDTKNFPVNHVANSSGIGQVVFGTSATGTQYLFAINGGNGIVAFYLSGGVVPPPTFLSQPHNTRALAGNPATFSVNVDQPATISWYKGTNPPSSTGAQGTAYAIANSQLTDVGDYFAIANNANGSATSHVAHLSIESTNDNFTFSGQWAANPTNGNSYPYVTTNGTTSAPWERYFAYNTLSNQLIVVRCPPNVADYTLWVVDANSGTNLYTLKTNGILHEGASEVSGANAIDLLSAAVADDGAVYISSMSPNSSGGAGADTNKMFHVYRWADSGSNTTPTLVFEGDPAGQSIANVRWGDVMAARGSGVNTELIVNSSDGVYGAVLKPKDGSMTQFTNYWFFDSGGIGPIGRSIQFGPTNSVFEKRAGTALVYSRFDTNAQTSATIYPSTFPDTQGGVFVVRLAGHTLAAGVDFVGRTTAPLQPDGVSLYDITDPTTPLFLGRINFPNNKVGNANFVCQTLMSGYRGYSLDANNGLMAFNLNPPVNSMVLTVAPSGANVLLSWGNPDAVLQVSDSLAPASWSDLVGPGVTSSTQPANAASKFYRLILRR